MDDRLATLERKVSRTVGRGGRARTAACRPGVASGDIAPDGLPDAAPAAAAARPTSDVTLVGVLSLVGRTCLILGGAYVLRALTDAGTLPRVGGTVLGIAYAIAWLGAGLPARRDRASG